MHPHEITHPWTPFPLIVLRVSDPRASRCTKLLVPIHREALLGSTATHMDPVSPTDVGGASDTTSSGLGAEPSPATRVMEPSAGLKARTLQRVRGKGRVGSKAKVRACGRAHGFGGATYRTYSVSKCDLGWIALF